MTVFELREYIFDLPDERMEYEEESDGMNDYNTKKRQAYIMPAARLIAFSLLKRIMILIVSGY